MSTGKQPLAAGYYECLACGGIYPYSVTFHGCPGTRVEIIDPRDARIEALEAECARLRNWLARVHCGCWLGLATPCRDHGENLSREEMDEINVIATGRTITTAADMIEARKRFDGQPAEFRERFIRALDEAAGENEHDPT